MSCRLRSFHCFLRTPYFFVVHNLIKPVNIAAEEEGSNQSGTSTIFGEQVNGNKQR